MLTTPDRLRPDIRAIRHDRDLLQAEKARRHLIPFTDRLYPAYEAAPFHHDIGDFIESILLGHIRYGVIILPPRHGKSTLASEHAPPFVLGRQPDFRIIACSHTQSLADKFSRWARGKFRHPRWPFPSVRLSPEVANVREWNTARPKGDMDDPYRGGYLAAGIGGPITGQGANLLLIDDPVKSRADADSPVRREASWDWFTGTALTRLESDSRVLLIGTRWHHDDLIGRALRRGNQWSVLHMPAIDDAGNALWPERFPRDPIPGVVPTEQKRSLQEIRADVGERNWLAQYQGRPTPDEGAIWKREWFRDYDHLPDGVTHFVQHWDTAFKSTAAADFSVCTTWAINPFGMWLVALWRGQVEFPELEREAKRQYEAWIPREVCIEDKASGQSLLQVLNRSTRIPAIAIPVCGNKEWRAHDVSPILESGRIHVPRWASWKDTFLQEAVSFPLADHDDQVDSVSQAIAREYQVGTEARTLSVTNYRDQQQVDDDDDVPPGRFNPRRMRPR